jgi:hypothetical protein
MHLSEFRIGGVSVEVAGARPLDVALVSALEPFRSQAVTSDVRLDVEWTDAIDAAHGREIFDSGAIWRLFDNDEEFLFDFNAPILGDQPYKRLTIDRQFRRAKLQISSECFSDSSCNVIPLEYPLDELLIMYRLTQEKAIELHGCGIVREKGRGNLFVGHSGAGKSTTTRLWTACEDVEVLSDDRIILRREEKQKQVPRFARNDKSFGGRPDLPSDRGHDFHPGIRMYGTPWHGEAMYASPNSAPLARIFVLEHGHGNVLTQLSPSQAVAELFARSFVPFHRHEYVESALEFLQEVVDAVPVYRFSFEPDRRAVDVILNLHD